MTSLLSRFEGILQIMFIGFPPTVFKMSSEKNISGFVILLITNAIALTPFSILNPNPIPVPSSWKVGGAEAQRKSKAGRKYFFISSPVECTYLRPLHHLSLSPL